MFFWTLGALCASALSGCKGEDVAVAPLEKDGDPFGEAFDGGDRGTLGDAASMLADIEPFEPLPPDDPQALSAPLDALINGFPGRFAIYAANLKNGASAARGADESLNAGSAIRLRVLATTSARRFADMQDIPTLVEIMKNDLLIQETWAGICMAVKTPAPLIRRLHAEIIRATQDPGVKKGMAAGGSNPHYSESPEAYQAYLAKEYEKSRELVRLSGVNAE